MGLSLSGFHHELLVERDSHACATLSHNKDRQVNHVKDWLLRSDDVRDVDWSSFFGNIDLVAGGPPCQPFSVGGKATGVDDRRDMWPEAVRAIRETMPKAFIFENVRGLLRPKFEEYVNWIAACLARPDIARNDGESHSAHLLRLERAGAQPFYYVQVVPVNAADYGAPQKRNRVLFIGLSNELGIAPSFPEPTHSEARLVWDKWMSGEYWARHKLPRPSEENIPTHEEAILSRLRKKGTRPPGKPWVTCRDAFATLGEPDEGRRVKNHTFQPGAKAYPGHTGSPIDTPAKALKAGVHGVPGGENMLLKEDGSVRYFTVREAATLQGFPDNYEFPGSWSESMRQLGNAVPVQLARFAGEWVRDVVEQLRSSQKAA